MPPSDAKTLLVVAHPDDEALWFSSVLTRHAPVDLVVATCGEDPQSAKRRRAELESSAELYGVASTTVLDQQDVAGRHLDLDALRSQLRPFAEREYAAVYTHGPLGETFEHPHHQDVCLVVHELFDEVLATSWNQIPSVVVTLSADEFRLKQRVMGSVYWPEYLRVRSTHELSAVEKFARHTRSVVLTAYGRERQPGDDSPYEIERRAAMSDLLARAGADAAGELAVITAPGSIGELYDAFVRSRGAHVISDLDPRLEAAARDAASGAGYEIEWGSLVAPRFERLPNQADGDPLDVYRAGAVLTLWARKRRPGPGLRARRRLRSWLASVTKLRES